MRSGSYAEPYSSTAGTTTKTSSKTKSWIKSWIRTGRGSTTHLGRAKRATSTGRLRLGSTSNRSAHAAIRLKLCIFQKKGHLALQQSSKLQCQLLCPSATLAFLRPP